MMFKKPLNSILIKPAGPGCNMACEYCFYLEKTHLYPDITTFHMSEITLREAIRQALDSGESQVSFSWQGGEPTLMGLSFYQTAVSYQKQYGSGKTVGNGFQTNGILIDRSWIDFFKEYRFLVGLSLDGPEHIHNRYRKYKNGRGSWKKVTDNAKRMLDGDVEVNALTVLNDYSAQFPEEIYAFHKSFGLMHMQFIPCVEPDSENSEKVASFSVSPESLGTFLCKMFDLWLEDFKNDFPVTFIRFFDSLFYLYVGLPAPQCTLLPECGNYVVVEHNGDVYACDFFVESEWKLGNVHENGLVDLLNSERQSLFGKLKVLLTDSCQECEWLEFCLGGCTKDRLRNPHNRNLSYFCESYKSFFRHANTRFRELAIRWKKRQRREAVQEKIKKHNIHIERNDPCPCGSGMKFKICCGS
jgi:uncharacterized protein